MSLPIVFEREVEADIDEAYHWYEQQRHGLGEGFLGAVRVTLDRIQLNPSSTRSSTAKFGAPWSVASPMPCTIASNARGSRWLLSITASVTRGAGSRGPDRKTGPNRGTRTSRLSTPMIGVPAPSIRGRLPAV